MSSIRTTSCVKATDEFVIVRTKNGRTIHGYEDFLDRWEKLLPYPDKPFVHSVEWVDGEPILTLLNMLRYPIHGFWECCDAMAREWKEYSVSEVAGVTFDVYSPGQLMPVDTERGRGDAEAALEVGYAKDAGALEQTAMPLDHADMFYGGNKNLTSTTPQGN